MAVYVDGMTLPIDTAIPCGLLVNELLTNAFKYAFPDDKKGEIVLSLDKEGSHFVMVIADDGVGLPENFSIDKQDTLGMTLVRNLIHQLGGEVLIENKVGVRYQIRFPES
jgi:two-component sensor histidine kinase